MVGLPVGFVNAAESKEALTRQNCPYITALGPKGGSAVAAAVVNALAIMALEEMAIMTPKTGTLYGIGVGPGDPELITLKALKVLERVPHIFASCSTKNSYSLALNIVRCHLNGAGIEHLPFPMTREPQVLEEAWEKNAQRVLEVLGTGADAAFVTLGDPLTYSTFGYLLKTLKRLHPEVRVITIPGITSYSAAAALTHIPLTEGEESFYLVSGALGAARLREVVDKSDNIVMLKTYRNFEEIYQALEELDLLDRATCISRCGLDGETVVENLRDLKGQPVPYLSMIIIKKKGKGLLKAAAKTSGGWGRWALLLVFGLLL